MSLVHASCVQIGDAGVLLRGASASGKSDLALRLIDAGARMVADFLVATLGSIGPVAILGGVFVITTTLSQVMSNTATAVLMCPIVLTAAAGMGVDPHPLMMGIAVAASTAFLTPIGTTTNLMVLGPGEYRFGDYAKVGAPLVTVFLVICLVLIPIIWPF